MTEPRTSTEQWLAQTVARQARAAGIRMPEVAICDSPEVNAFATEVSKNSPLIAVSTGSEEWRQAGVVEGSRKLTFVDASGRTAPEFLPRFTAEMARTETQTTPP